MIGSTSAERAQTRTDRVEATLRRAILTGELDPGQKLMITELERRYGVSQTPIREALQRLGSSGLVELNAQQGARVASVSTQDMLEIYELRMLLEPVAIRRSLRWTRSQNSAFQTELEAKFSDLEHAIAPEMEDVVEFERVHREFHKRLIAACDSKWMRRIVEDLMDHSGRYQLLSSQGRGTPEEIIAEHRRIHEAALAGDIDLVTDLTYQHLRFTVDLVLHSHDMPAEHPLAHQRRDGRPSSVD